MKSILTTICCVSLFFNTYSQNSEELKAINRNVWNNFTRAFETLDYELFASLHSENLLRINGNNKSIRYKTDYIDSYKQSWNNKSIKQTITFRFIERIADEKSASERGIYKLTRNPNTPNEVSYYGKFHVMLKKENGVWKLVVDYDSTENNTINEALYNEAYAIDDFTKY